MRYGGVPGEEDARQKRAYLYYRNLGPEKRSLEKVAEKFGMYKTSPGIWSSKFHWLQRVKEYDEKVLGIVAKSTEKATIEQMKKVHTLTLKSTDNIIQMVDKVIKKAKKVLNDGGFTPTNIAELRIVAGVLGDVVKLRELVTGGVTERTEQKFTLEELLKLDGKDGNVDKKTQIKAQDLLGTFRHKYSRDEVLPGSTQN